MLSDMKKSIYSNLPSGLSPDSEDFHAENYLFGNLSKEMVDDLAELLAGRKILEVYAGRGHLAAALQEKGLDVKATSLRMGHDGSSKLGHVTDVEELSAMEAVCKYNPWMNALLVSWPTTDGNLAKSLQYLPDDALIIFIGEVTDYTAKPAFLGGCATDDFFEAVEEVPALTEKVRYPTRRMDKLKVYRKKQDEDFEI